MSLSLDVLGFVDLKKGENMKCKRNWFNIMCVAIIICNVVGISYSVKVNYKREKLNQRYEELIELKEDQYHELERNVKDFQLLRERLWTLLLNQKNKFQ